MSPRPKIAEKEGIIRVTAGAFGFTEISHPKTKKVETFFFPPGSLATALDGDTVSFVKTKGDNGQVTKITKRARTEFVGSVIDHKPNYLLAKPDNQKFYTDFLIESEENLEIGTKVLIKLKAWPKGVERPSGQIIKVLGTAGEHETEMQAIMAEKGFIYDFPGEVEIEAKKEKENFLQNLSEEIKKRRDFRGTTTFTIDPANAKDFDDALSVKELENGLIEIGVHIADVSHYVRPKSALDEEAQKRTTSVYLVDRTIPMLPEILSNDLCSLVPDQDRLTYSAVFVLDKNAEVKEQWFGRTIIHSDRRFTYEEVHEIIAHQNGPFYQELKILNEIAQKLDRQKIKAGALAFEEDEVKFEIDSEGRPISVYKKERLESHKLVEDFMLLANKKVAEFVSAKIKNRNMAFVYRIHDAPDPDKLENLTRFIRLFGHKLNFKGKRPRPQEINDFLKSIANSPDESVITKQTIRTMNRALYSMKNIGHFGLAFDHYTHFTSPIRRYPDIMVHRLLDLYLNKKQPPHELLLEYDNMCERSSNMEKLATEAERDSIKFKQAEYLGSHTNKIFDGVISGITKWGMYIEELTTGAEGLIRLRDMKDDHYIFDEKNFQLQGQNNKKNYRLGDTLKIKVVKTDPIAKTIDFAITD